MLVCTVYVCFVCCKLCSVMLCAPDVVSESDFYLRLTVEKARRADQSSARTRIRKCLMILYIFVSGSSKRIDQSPQSGNNETFRLMFCT